MRNVIRHWTTRAGSRLPELTAAMFLLLGLAVTGWIVAGNSKNLSADGKGAAVQPVSGKVASNAIEIAGMR